MKPRMSIRQVANKTSAISQAIKALTDQDVFIGVPEDTSARKEEGDSGITNAYLLYIHEHGVPENNLPARPSLIPGIEDIQSDAKKILKEMGKKVLEGKPGSVEKGLNTIGLLGQNAVRARFVNNDWVPLTDATLNRRNKVSEKVNKNGEVIKKMGQSRRERGATNPLIDKQELRKSITYVVRKRGSQEQEPTS